MAEQFKYSGSEALAMVKQFFPHTWQEKLQCEQDFIHSMMHVWKCDAQTACTHYLKKGLLPESQIFLLAALHVILNKEKAGTIKMALGEIDALRQQQLNMSQQSQAIETSTTHSQTDKQMLRAFYLGKQAEFQKQIDDLVNSIEVNEPQVLIIQTNLFADGTDIN